jgi:hypothetical protein
LICLCQTKATYYFMPLSGEKAFKDKRNTSVIFNYQYSHRIPPWKPLHHDIEQIAVKPIVWLQAYRGNYRRSEAHVLWELRSCLSTIA